MIKMKKKWMFAICSLCFLLTSSYCAGDLILERKMIKYYQNYDSYEFVTGTYIGVTTNLTNFELDLEKKELFFIVRFEEGNTEHFQQGQEYPFLLFYQKDSKIDYKSLLAIQENSKITIQTAHMTFYNGHVEPLISLEQDGKMILSFNDGYESNLRWVDWFFNES